MALKRDDFDAYYLIICSRGPGSETLTIDRPETMEGIRLVAGSAQTFKKFGVCEGMAEWNDEGPLILVPKGTLPLTGIFKWIAYDQARWDEELKKETVDLLKQLKSLNATDRAIFQDIAKAREENMHAFLSAAYRVFLQKLKFGQNRWTSCNAWRKLDLEIPSKRQFKLLLDATGLTVDELEKWNCKVMKKACELYRRGKLPSKDFRGC